MSAQTTAIEVALPSHDVFEYVTDPEKFGEWQADVTGGHLEGGGASRLGARCVTIRRIGFAERSVTSEITLFDPPHRWVYAAWMDPSGQSLMSLSSRPTVAEGPD